MVGQLERHRAEARFRRARTTQRPTRRSRNKIAPATNGRPRQGYDKYGAAEDPGDLQGPGPSALPGRLGERRSVGDGVVDQHSEGGEADHPKQIRGQHESADDHREGQFGVVRHPEPWVDGGQLRRQVPVAGPWPGWCGRFLRSAPATRRGRPGWRRFGPPASTRWRRPPERLRPAVRPPWLDSISGKTIYHSRATGMTSAEGLRELPNPDRIDALDVRPERGR